MIKLVVFDWNGTLLADTQAVLEGVNKEIAVLNVKPITMRQYRDYYDIPLTEFYKHFGISPNQMKQKTKEMSVAFHSYYEPRAAEVRTRAGTKRILEELAARDIPKIILSNHTIEGIYLQLERLKLTHHFDVVLANEGLGGAHFSGKQERLNDYLESNNVDPKEAIIVGDTVEEVRIGKNLGLNTVVITGGYNSETRLKQAKPNFLIHNLDDLIGIIKGL